MILKESTEKYYNPILEKSFKFAIRIIRFYKLKLSTDYHLNSLFKQLLRSGTSIGANVSEAQSAFTKKDFINKPGISLKESEVISLKEFSSLFSDCEEISKLLTSIIKSSKSS